MGLDQPKLLIYFEEEEHLVRRLGAAVISCWADLDAATRARIVARAKDVLADDSDDRLDDSLNHFITMHDRGISDAA